MKQVPNEFSRESWVWCKGCSCGPRNSTLCLGTRKDQHYATGNTKDGHGCGKKLL